MIQRTKPKENFGANTSILANNLLKVINVLENLSIKTIGNVKHVKEICDWVEGPEITDFWQDFDRKHIATKFLLQLLLQVQKEFCAQVAWDLLETANNESDLNKKGHNQRWVGHLDVV